MKKRKTAQIPLHGGAMYETPLNTEYDVYRTIQILEMEREHMKNRKSEAKPNAPKKPSKRYAQHTPSVQEDFDFSVLEDFE